ncbi:hypothetical protein [Methylobacterium sp. J-070]|uniref:hypothetical protein n=1 Tax=Methylobacterium sp. J-070 TaxID=2836650 RepID=UPI001FBABF5D|nr:hypothetical protein [Methylobacterium sp. J-070]MCJ2049680.1 hypothetical protein [Methylobacterium sp. J-070]
MQPRSPRRFRAARCGGFAAALLAAPLAATPFGPALVAVAARAGDAAGPVWPEPDGTLVLARPFGRSEISLRLARRVAGAVDTLTWDGVTFLADTEPADALQARAALGSGSGRRRVSEAGGPQAAEPAARRLRALRSGRSWAETETRLAWDPPETGAAADVILHKRVALGLPGLGNAVEVQARFVLPGPAAAARFEPLTLAVPAEFSEAWRFDPATGALSRRAAAPGEEPAPVVLATPEGSHALAVWSPDPPAQEPDAPRPRFTVRPGPGATRLGCAVRIAEAAAGNHDFACYALVGTLADVRSALRTLTAPE